VRASFHWHFLKKREKDCTGKITPFWEVKTYLTTSLLSNLNPLINLNPPEFLLLSQGDFFAICCEWAVVCGLAATVVPSELEVSSGCKIWDFQRQCGSEKTAKIEPFC
jgi:hypothetical protein